VQEPSVWLPWQAAADVGNDCDADKVAFHPPKAVMPRPLRTDGGTVDSGILDVTVALGNVMLSYLVSRPTKDAGSKLGIVDIVEVDTPVAIVTTSVWFAKAGMTVSAARAIGTTPTLTAFAAGLSLAHLKGSFGYFLGLRMPEVAK